MTDLPTPTDRRRASTHVLLAPDQADVLGLDAIAPDDDVEHHLRRVLRLSDGEAVSVTDGAGRWRMCRVVAGPRHSLEPTSRIVQDEPLDPFTLVSAVPKGDRVDWLVQKATELGVGRIVLVQTERSAVRWKPERAAKQIGRLNRIADEALRQSRRTWRCSVEWSDDPSTTLAGSVLAEPGGARISGREQRIAVGPEGGWSDRELALAGSHVSLGDTVLRTETAAVVACTLRLLT